MSLTVCIVWQYILSRVRVSVRPSNFFIREKHPKPRGNRITSTCVYLNDPATGHECQLNRQKGGVNFVTLGSHRRIEHERRRLCVCVRACVRLHVRACMHVRAWESACVRDLFAIYEKKISPRLIMIIIKIIILYFIQIRHTDDFPSTGTRLVLNNVPNAYTQFYV